MYKGPVKCYPVRPTRSMGDYVAVGMGDVSAAVLTPVGVTQAGGITPTPLLQATAVLDQNAGKSSLPKIALIGTLVGAGGYLLYRHFKKGR